MLQEKIIESFHKTSSSKPFQIVFTTHNVKLMDIQDIFRRDQVWFVDKNSYGESKISSLLEFKDKTRKDLILERNYYK
jgi:AAA15 family ATPase/GTPase